MQLVVTALVAALVLAVAAAAAAWRGRALDRLAWRRLRLASAALLEHGRELFGLPGRPSDDPSQLAFALDELSSRLQHEWKVAQEERRRLSSVLGGLREGIILLDRWGGVLVTNRAADELWPRLSPRLRGKNQIVLFQDPELDAALSRAMSEDTAQAVEHVRPGPPRRYYEVRILPLPRGQAPVISSFEGDADGASGLLLVVRDVTERRAVEQMRRDFVANVSHELQTPLTSIQGFAETLRDDDALPPADRRHFLDLILGESRRMSALVNDLLELARLEAGAWPRVRERVDMGELARQVIEASQPRAARKRLALGASLQAAPVEGDPAELRRAIENLVANALTYTPEGGRVSVRTGLEGGLAFVEVRDSGIGIPEQALPRIFERFYRVDKGRSRSAGGTGLGLAIVRHVVESHGGRVTVESREGAGSTFTCTLPAAQSDLNR